jgi:hypothetical protein
MTRTVAHIRYTIRYAEGKSFFIGGIFIALLVVALGVIWLVDSVTEWRTGQHLLPWNAYQDCGDQAPAMLPETVKVGFYEEFPVPWRLNKLAKIDFPVKLAVAATSRDDFLKLRDSITQTYPQVSELYFWPLLSDAEGYYPGSWSDADAVERVAKEADGLPVLWDLERPRGQLTFLPANILRNIHFLDQWLSTRKEPTQIWRSNAGMGLNPLFLRLIGMHFDPLDYSTVRLQLDLYMTGAGAPDDQLLRLLRLLRCGVERYHERFVPSLGVLNDGEGDPSVFIPSDTLRRVLMRVRASGVQEVWFFGSNGINDEFLSILRETLPSINSTIHQPKPD